jgi:hypothetical protein
MTTTTADVRLPRVRFRPTVRPGGVLAGIAGGLSLIVLLQQFGIIFPTLTAVIAAVVAGAVLVVAMANVARSRAVARLNRRLTGAEAALLANEAGGVGASGGSSTAWAPSHTVPDEGLPAYDQPDADTEAAAQLDPGLEVEVVETWGDWSLARCSNGWSAWVDGRVLTEVER